MSILHNKQINPLDYYLIQNIKTGKLHEIFFRGKKSAENFIKEWGLDGFEIIINPKYNNTKNVTPEK